MPTGDGSVVAEFLRYHVLVRVFDGDPDAWLAQLRERGGDDGDVRFVRWIRSRLRQDPSLLDVDPQDGRRDAVLARRGGVRYLPRRHDRIGASSSIRARAASTASTCSSCSATRIR